MLPSNAIKFLQERGLTEETASEAKMSDAKAYDSCYNWYIENQKVLSETAAIASRVWIEKYALHNNDGICLESTPEDMWKRVASCLADIELQTNKTNSKTKEEWETEFYDTLKDWKYSPGGSGLFALGNPYVNSSASNCFHLSGPNYGDSLEGIFELAKDMSTLFKMRGGVGTDISHLRPSGSLVNNAAKTSSGAVSFMDLLSVITATIGQQGRRAALSITIRVDHPDIFDFISIKQDLDKQWFFNELKSVGIDINHYKYSSIAAKLKNVSYANISVKLTDEFINAVENDSDFELWYEFEDNKYPRISRIVKARDIWNKLISGATRSAEPGLINESQVLRESIGDCYSSVKTADIDLGNGLETVSVDMVTRGINPSLRWNTKVLTDRGVFKIKDLAEDTQNPLRVKTGNGVFCEAEAFLSGMDKQLVKISFTNGQEVFCTKEHKWPVLTRALSIRDGRTNIVNKKLSTELKSRDKIYCPFDKAPINNINCLYSELDGFVLGWNQGDGWISYHKTNESIQYGFIFSAEDISSGIGNTVLSYSNSIAKRPSTLRQDHDSMAMTFVTTDSNFVSHMERLGARNKKDGLPKTVWEGNSRFIKGYVDGLFSADGSVELLDNISRCRVILTSAHLTLVKDVRDLLAFYGIKSYIVSKHIDNCVFPNEKYNNTGKIYHSHRLCISGLNAKKFAEVFTLSNINKQAKLSELLFKDDSAYANSREYLVVDSVEVTDIYEDVYDITVNDDTHTFITSTGLTGNCGEQFLPNGSNCCLGSFYLPAFIKNPWSDKAEFDFPLFKNTIQAATRMQDNIKEFDIKTLPLKINKVSAIVDRRIGLSCHGMADALASLGISYGSESSISFLGNLYNFLKNESYLTSVKLAEDKGAFPIWNPELEKNNPFLNRFDPEVRSILSEKPRRNLLLLTGAPTGSLSILSRNSSSGSEPVFKLSYTRNVRKQGSDGYEQYKVYHQAYKDCLDAGGNTSAFIEASKVDGFDRIKLQSTLQKHVCSAISNTCNLPEGTSEEYVSSLYLQAFKSGLKGFTVYVENSRGGVLISNETTTSKPRNCKKFERPKTTDVDIFKIRHRDKNYMILIGKMPDGRPIECFGGLEDGLSLPTKYEKAQLTKKSKGHYTLTIQLSEDPEDIMRVNNIGNRFPAQDLITITRMISLALKNSIAISDIIYQLTRSATSIYDAPMAFARVLKGYMTDEEVIETEKAKGKVCPTCGGSLLFKRESGCLTEMCNSCSYTSSKCG